MAKPSAYFEIIKDLPVPNDEQLKNFAEHVADAHSWYKHLSLFRGAEFIVFMDPLAGGDFDEHQERIHHTWQTSRQYREYFGHLAYMWRRHDEEAFSTDYELNARISLSTMEFTDRRETPVLNLPREIQDACGFRLYPFACDNGVLISRYEDIFPAMEQGIIDHPCRDLLVRFYHAAVAFEENYPDPDSVSEYEEAFGRLRNHELDKVKTALRNLRAFLPG